MNKKSVITSYIATNLIRLLMVILIYFSMVKIYQNNEYLAITLTMVALSVIKDLQITIELN